MNHNGTSSNVVGEPHCKERLVNASVHARDVSKIARMTDGIVTSPVSGVTVFTAVVVPTRLVTIDMTDLVNVKAVFPIPQICDACVHAHVHAPGYRGERHVSVAERRRVHY